MFGEFAKTGPTAEELDVARLQMANRLDTDMKEPRFWLSQISQMKYRKRPIEDLKLLPDVYQTFSAKQLQNVVKKYMKDNKIIRFVAIPNTTDAEAKQKDKALVPAKGY